MIGLSVEKNVCICADEGVSIEYTLYRSNGERIFYSLEIEETVYGVPDRIFLEDVTEDFLKAETLFTLFSSMTVTVCTAYDILCDLLPL